MNDYNEYTYGRTLRFFDAYYPYDTEDVHYANVMLSMSQCKTIDELIEVRERLKEKIKKIGGVDTLDKLPKNIIDALSTSVSSNNSKVRFQHWTSNLRDNLKSDVDSCYDENVFRIFQKSDTITENSCGECFVNMTYCTPNSSYKNKIISEAKERAGIDVSVLLAEIAKRYREFEEHWKTYQTFKEGMNGYDAAKLAVEDDFDYLKQFNWRLLPSQKLLYSKIDREEIKRRELQLKLLKERKEQRERVAKEEEERKQKEYRKKAIAIIIIKIVIFAIIFVAIMALLVQIPSGVWNWIIAFIVWLAIMKTILSKM